MEELRLVGLKALRVRWDGVQIEIDSPSYRCGGWFDRGWPIEREAKCNNGRRIVMVVGNSGKRIVRTPQGFLESEENDRQDTHVPPEENCNCGIHASWSERPVVDLIYPEEPSIFAIVLMEGWGKVAVHENGWRAQFARVIGIVGLLSIGNEASIHFGEEWRKNPIQHEYDSWMPRFARHFSSDDEYKNFARYHFSEIMEGSRYDAKKISNRFGVDRIPWGIAEAEIKNSKREYREFELQKMQEHMVVATDAIKELGKSADLFGAAFAQGLWSGVKVGNWIGVDYAAELEDDDEHRETDTNSRDTEARESEEAED